MAESTNIEWCDATLNLWCGCTKVSEGCKNCYAEHLSDTRYHKGAWGPSGVRREVKSWRSTLNKISKRAKDEGRRLRVFCQSMSDTFEGPETCGGVESANWRLMERLRADLFYEIPRHKELDFLLLTKRPHNIKRTIRECWTAANSPELMVTDNAWFGTSVENQKTADERIPHLLSIPAKVRFLSCEPLIGSISLSEAGAIRWDAVGGELGRGFSQFQRTAESFTTGLIDWFICGGESGPGARPMNPDWPRTLRDQCVAANVPFFFKQWGEWKPLNGTGIPHGDDDETSYPWVWVSPDGSTKKSSDGCSDRVMVRVGKKVAGRLLDGREWNEFPEVK